MSKTYIQRGDALTLPAPSGGVVSGTAYLIGAIFGVASVSAAEGVDFTLDTVGVFTLPKATGAGITLGAKTYWDNTAKNVTATASGNTLIGVVTVAAGSADTTAAVRLNGSF